MVFKLIVFLSLFRCICFVQCEKWLDEVRVFVQLLRENLLRGADRKTSRPMNFAPDWVR